MSRRKAKFCCHNIIPCDTDKYYKYFIENGDILMKKETKDNMLDLAGGASVAAVAGSVGTLFGMIGAASFSVSFAAAAAVSTAIAATLAYTGYTALGGTNAKTKPFLASAATTLAITFGAATYGLSPTIDDYVESRDGLSEQMDDYIESIKELDGKMDDYIKNYVERNRMIDKSLKL